MRLICPNCDAQYEVDDAVIPDEGRDVQCSNCGHTWFQHAARAAAVAPPVPEAEDIGWHGETTAPQAPAPEPGPSAAARRALDASVLNILQEEAAREQRVREQEAATETFSSQPDLGLDSAPPRRAAPAADAVMAAVSAPAPAPGPDGGAAAAGRDLLPDLAEINASLDASSDRGADSIVTAEAEARAERSGFRLGFVLVLLVAAVALGAYLMAPEIGALHPALEAPMEGYAAAVDGLRLWLHALLPQSAGG
ncbi:zinc-ribbon domain-containing protein [Rhodovulum strictum]|nr:zinc-ribbon domain-containing protein [Rhodovulum strictum]